MTIGKRIKELRKKHKFTQEKVAEYLNISYQAVSKWENELANPDISLLLPLSNLFDVSIEYLLEGTETGKEEIDKILKKSTRFMNDGRVTDNIQLLEEAHKLYPKSYLIMYRLASALFVLPKDKKGDQADEIKQRVVSLCERVYEDSNDDNLKHHVVFLLIATYKDLGRIEEAKKLVYKQPFMMDSRQSLLTLVLEKEEGHKHLQVYIMNLVEELQRRMKQLTYPKFNGHEYSNNERIGVLKKVILLLDLFFENTDPFFFHVRYKNLHEYIARLYAREEDEGKTLDHLEKAFYHSKRFDNLGEETVNYSSIFFDTIEHSSTQNTRNVEETSTQELSAYLERDEFDFIRHNERFVKLVTETKM